MKRTLILIASLLLAACAADDSELEQNLSPAAVPLTNRQLAEILFHAGCENTVACYNRDSTGMSHPGSAEQVRSCELESVRLYCGEEPQPCASDPDFKGTKICQPRDCAASSGVFLEQAVACTNAIAARTNCLTPYPACQEDQLF